MDKENIHFKYILRRENLNDWKIKISNSGGGLCIFKTRIILLDEEHKNNLPLFLHEVAHAKTDCGHDGIFADKFTKLVGKYMQSRPVFIN